MANEIRVTVSATNQNFSDDFKPGQITVDQTAKGGAGGITIVGTTAETLTFGDVATLGWLMLENLDATNYVTYGPDSTGIVNFGRIEAGEVAIMRIEPGITFKWIANTASVRIAWKMWED